MRNKILLINVLMMVVLLSLLAACGKVGDPRPRLPKGDDSLSRLNALFVSNLTPAQSSNGVLLTWRLYGDSILPEKIIIYRADFNIEDGDCRDCPPLQKGIIKELSGEELKNSIQDGGYAYEDRDVRQGFLYKYSLQLCAGQNICQDPSPEAVMHFGKKTEE